jgi:hypothetical protein
MGKKCNVFNFKNDIGHTETVIQISEMENHDLTLQDVDGALVKLRMKIREEALNNDLGYAAKFDMPIEK